MGQIKSTKRNRLYQTGEDHKNWKGGKITKTCVRCGSPFQVYPSTASRTHCSLACANRDLADKQKGVVNPKKIHYGEENGSWKGGLIELTCIHCGKAFYRRPYAAESLFCSRKCAATLQALVTGGPNYIDGRSPLDHNMRRYAAYLEWRTAVLERDNYTCQKCGTKEKVQAHHIKSYNDYPDLRFVVSNGQTLCLSCHRKTFSKK